MILHAPEDVIIMKLVRDRIPEMMMEQGKAIEIRVASDSEYESMLLKKLQEEVAEFMHDKDIEEMADIEEVLRCYAEHKGIDWGQVEEIRQKKHEEKGSFKKKIVLMSVG